MSKQRLPRTTSAIIGFPLFFLCIIVVFLLLQKAFFQTFLSEESVEAWVGGMGVNAWWVFILVQIVQVVVFIIPGEITQIAGGYLFGVWMGTLLSVVGIFIGSIFNFLVARLLGAGFVKAVFGEEKFQSFSCVVGTRKALLGFAILFAIPGFPKDSLCYLGGMARVRLVPFFLISTCARLPGIIGSSFIGASLVQRRVILTILLFALASTLLVLSYVFRKDIMAWLHRLTGSSADDSA